MFLYLIMVPVAFLLLYYLIKYGGPFTYDVILLIVRFITYICQYVLYIITFTFYDIRTMRGFVVVDRMEPGKVDEVASKFETDNNLKHGTADYGRRLKSWRLYSRKWTN